VPLRILVAEDNPTNQKVASSMLKRLGHHADLVGNGGEALDALKLLPYDLVLMDVQMPEMDGLEASRRFRALERGTGRHLPIIAMTAHASLADRERCLDAGMDDFITKPVQRDVLGRLIIANFEKYKPEAAMSSDSKSNTDATTLSAEQSAAAQSDAGPAAQSDPGIDAPSPSGSGFTFDVMVERLDNDEEIAREIAGIFVSSSEELLVELVAAVSDRDAEVIRARAHAMKGSAGNIGANALQDLAGAMERAGRDGNLDEAEGLLPRLRASLEQVNGVLSTCG
jgi:CheY-like chemotaxis protein